MKGKIKKTVEKYVKQREDGEENRNKILEIIGESKKRFSEIKSKITFSDPILTKHLDRMQKEGLIEKKLYNNKLYYVLTKKGIKTISFDTTKSLQSYLARVRKNDGWTFYDYSELGIALGICSLPWGIDPHLTINTKLEKLKLLKSDDVKEIEKLLYKKIRKNVKNIREQQSKFKTDALELLENDRFVLGFNIDLAKVHESIKKNSLEKFEAMTEEEVKSHFDADNAMADGIY